MDAQRAAGHALHPPRAAYRLRQGEWLPAHCQEAPLSAPFRLDRDSVVDPNTLNLDPAPEFWPNLEPCPGPDPDPGLNYQYNNSVESLNWEFLSKIFCLHFILYLQVWILIRIPNTDPNPEGS